MRLQAISGEARGACQYRVSNVTSFGVSYEGQRVHRVCAWRGIVMEGAVLLDREFTGGQYYHASHCEF